MGAEGEAWTALGALSPPGTTEFRYDGTMPLSGKFSGPMSRPLAPRRIVPSVVVAVPLLLVGLLPAGCATEDVGPGKGSGYVVWIAQEIKGKVQREISGVPIAGAAVTISAGFQLDALIPIASGTTGADGTFDILRADATGVPGDFWWFVVDEATPVTLIVQAKFQHRDYFPAYPVVTVARIPSRDPPGTNFGAYVLSLSSFMTPVIP
jgi:hypothetical protein